MKRIVSAIAAFLLTVAGVVAVESPASAQWNDFNGTIQHIVTGESVSWDWNLCGDGATDNWFTEGSLPPGLSLAPSGALTGIATEPGTYYVGNFHCSLYIQGYGQINNAGSNSGGITIAVTQNPSPTPIVNIESQVNTACEFHISGQVPVTPKAGSVKLTLGNGTSSGVYQLSDLAPLTTFNVTASLQDLSTMFNNSVVVGANRTPTIGCGDTISASLSYSTGYDGVATATSSVKVDLPEPPTIVSVTNLNDALCDIRVVGTLPTSVIPGSVLLSFTDGTDTLVATLTSSTAGQLIDLTIPTKPFSLLALPSVASVSSTNGYQPACGQAVSVTLSYRHSGPATVSKATPFVTPTQGIVGTPVVSLTVVGGPNCLVAVTAYIPMASDDTSLFVGDFTGNGLSGLHLADYPTDRPFTVLVPMNAINTTSSPYVTGSSVEIDPYHCGGEVSALISLGTIEASLANLSTLVYGQSPSPQTTSLSCGLGTLKAISGVCAPAVRGFYVNVLDALTASACPVGYTTAGIGATSANDCYKVIAQTVKGLKAPKAMKFKSVIPLPLVTTATVSAQVTATGACTVTTVAAGGKVAGKKVKVATLAVTAGTVAGNCVLSYSSPEVQHFGTYSQTLTIKVNKKGK